MQDLTDSVESSPVSSSPEDELRSPSLVRRRLDQLTGARQAIERSRQAKQQRLEELTAYLALAAPVEDALDQLSQRLFGDLIAAIEKDLSFALQEILDQPLTLKVDRDFKRGAVSMTFRMERDGAPEDIMRGQGGSVVNVLSVGLRILALTTLDPAVHRRLLILDEQDCWLRPDLVPRLARIVHEAGAALGFQVIMISHHDVSAFEHYAEKVYRFAPAADGVAVRPVHLVGQADPPAQPTQPDEERRDA